MISPDGCSHGNKWEEDCVECEKISLRATIASFKPLAEYAEKRLKDLESGISSPAYRPNEKDVVGEGK